MVLGAYGGLRSGELFALRRERLDSSRAASTWPRPRSRSPANSISAHRRHAPAGVSAHEVAPRAGHTSSSVVLDRYGHLLPHAEERVTNAFDNLGRAGAATTRGAVVLEFPREEWFRTRYEPASATRGTGSELGLSVWG